MNPDRFVDTVVKYTLEVDGELVIVENVPAHVCVETGEQLFDPLTVDRLQTIIWDREGPARRISTVVYNYVA